MQVTTFNSVNQADGEKKFAHTSSWLRALYASGSLKKCDAAQLYHAISCEISFEKIERTIDYAFGDKKNLIQALMQSTFCHEIKGELPSNERLEFIGDSLVNFMVGKTLYLLYPEMAEGDLSKLRGALVNEERLADLARAVHLGEFLFLGKGEFQGEGAHKNSILADAFEALMAAVYFDSQEDVLALKKVFGRAVSAWENGAKKEFYSREQLEIFDVKSKLQERVVAATGVFPVYKSSELEGGQGFLVELWIDGVKMAEMEGTSKKKIEKLLAKKVMDEHPFLPNK